MSGAGSYPRLAAALQVPTILVLLLCIHTQPARAVPDQNTANKFTFPNQELQTFNHLDRLNVTYETTYVSSVTITALCYNKTDPDSRTSGALPTTAFSDANRAGRTSYWEIAMLQKMPDDFDECWFSIRDDADLSADPGARPSRDSFHWRYNSTARAVPSSFGFPSATTPASSSSSSSSSSSPSPDAQPRFSYEAIAGMVIAAIFGVTLLLTGAVVGLLRLRKRREDKAAGAKSSAAAAMYDEPDRRTSEPQELATQHGMTELQAGDGQHRWSGRLRV